MLILFVNNGDKSNEFYKNMLKACFEEDSIVFVNSIDSAKIFIETEIVNKNNYIDVVLTNNLFYTERTTLKSSEEGGKDLAIWLKNSQKSYLDCSLQLRSIPINLIDTDRMYTHTNDLIYNTVLNTSDVENTILMVNNIRSSVRGWINLLVNDFDMVGINPYMPQRVTAVQNISKCNILTREYVLMPYRLPMLAFQDNINSSYRSIEVLENAFKRISKRKKDQQEKHFHDILMSNQMLLLGSAFDKFFYEKHFSLGLDNGSYIEPDFIRRHRFFNFTRMADSLEIKLPKEKFVARKDTPHPSLRASFNRYLDQVRDNIDYFENSGNSKEIARHLAFVPNMKHSLLIGRSDDREENQYILNKRLRQTNSMRINIITYDDLLESRTKLLEAKKDFTLPIKA